jgi:hypothetical protein
MFRWFFIKLMLPWALADLLKVLHMRFSCSGEDQNVPILELLEPSLFVAS